MRKLLSLLMCFLLGAALVSAAEETGGVEPDSLWYGLDLALEKIHLVFTFSSAKKADLHMQYAAERLAEAKAISDKGKNDLVEQSVNRYNAEVTDATAEVDAAKVRGEKLEVVAAKIEKAASNHVQVLTDLLGKVPETAKKGIQNAIENSQKGKEKALEAIGKKTEKKEEKAEAKEEKKAEPAEAKKEEKKEEKAAEKAEKKEEPKVEEKKEVKAEEQKVVIDSDKFNYDVRKFSDHVEVFGKVNGKSVKFRIEGDQYNSDAELKLRIVREVIQQYGYDRKDAQNAIVNMKISPGVKSEIALVKKSKSTSS